MTKRPSVRHKKDVHLYLMTILASREEEEGWLVLALSVLLAVPAQG